jgi:hypothetical protein
MRAKYGIQDCDFYNFDETGFMMGVIAQQWLLPALIDVAEARQFSQGIGNRLQQLCVSTVKEGVSLHF